MDLSRDSTVVATPLQVGADLGEEVIILHLTNGRYFGLGNVGARIWKLLRDPVTIGEIERVLLEEYEVAPERCHDEVQRLVNQLVDQGLVEVETA